MTSPPGPTTTDGESSSPDTKVDKANTPNLLTIPPELRLQVYDHVFTTTPLLARVPLSTDLLDADSDVHLEVPTIPAILQTSRPLRREALPVFLQAVKSQSTALRATTAAMWAEFRGFQGCMRWEDHVQRRQSIEHAEKVAWRVDDLRKRLEEELEAQGKGSEMRA